MSKRFPSLSHGDTSINKRNEYFLLFLDHNACNKSYHGLIWRCCPMIWDGWPMERLLILLTGIGYLMIFVQVTLFHYRQNFRHWSMWIPVIELPLFGLLSIIFVFFGGNLLFTILAVSFVIGTLSGMTGSIYHFRGIGQRVGGYELRNFLIGPPLMLPGTITAFSLLGLIALFWR